MSLSIPIRFADGVGNVPAAANWNDDYDWLSSLVLGLAFLGNGSMEVWANGNTFTNPANGATLADNWVEIKSGTTPCTADVTREASTVDSGLYSMNINITGAGSSDSYWAIKQSVVQPATFGSLTVLAGIKVKVATANKVRVKVYDGTTTVYSSYHTGDGTWQLLQAKLACAASPSEVTVTIEINPANFTDAVYLDSAYLYVVPSAISARAQSSLIYTPLSAASTPPALVTTTTVNNKATNILDNGGFEIWQRGSTFTSPASGIYTADRWYHQHNGTGTATISKNTTGANVSGGLAALSFAITAVGTGTTQICVAQAIENFADYNGKIVTLTVRVKTSASTFRVRIADDSSTYLSSAHTGSGNYETLSVTTSALVCATQLLVQVGIFPGDTVSTGTAYFDSAMLVLGGDVAAFVPTSPSIDLIRCQRYFEKTYPIAVAPGTSDGNTVLIHGSQYAATSVQAFVPFKVRKRVAPTVTLYIQSGTSGQLSWISSGGTTTARTTTVANPTGIGFYARQTAATDLFAEGHWTADAEI